MLRNLLRNIWIEYTVAANNGALRINYLMSSILFAEQQIIIWLLKSFAVLQLNTVIYHLLF